MTESRRLPPADTPRDTTAGGSLGTPGCGTARLQRDLIIGSSRIISRLWPFGLWSDFLLAEPPQSAGPRRDPPDDGGRRLSRRTFSTSRAREEGPRDPELGPCTIGVLHQPQQLLVPRPRRCGIA